MYKRMISLVLGLILVVVLIQGVPQLVRAEAETEKLTISILGDSISTFLDHSNGAAADTTNSTIRNGRKWFPYGNVTTVDMTWWSKAAELLNAQILVNNSWSGSCMYYTHADTVGAYVDRCVQLHDDTGDNAGEEPDIIAVYLGTNDIGAYSNDPGSYEAIDFSKLIVAENGSVTYAEPQNVIEAYAIALDKISRRYPDAQVYCFTLLRNVCDTTRLESYNASVTKLAAHFNMHIVDLYNCGITGTSDGTMWDGWHPAADGMTLIAKAFAEAVRENHEHSYTSVVTKPTCTSPGYTTYTCACGHSYTVEKKLTISILGDSISTFPNYSNGTAAGTTNSTITNGEIYYPLGDVSAVEDTWWYKASKLLNAEILVNNSWSGSCLYQTRFGTVGAYVDRCVQLHDDTGDNAGEEPDIIAIYMGTNDFNTYPSTLGTYAGIDFAKLISEADGKVTYAQPSNTMESYAIVLDKISRRYPNAEVYCFTLLPFPSSKTQPTDFNADIKSLAEHFGAYVVDLCDCGFSSDSATFDRLMLNYLHPNADGMTIMANAFAEAVRENQHTYTATVTAPTCTEKGYTTHTCEHCGDSYVDSYVDTLDHDYKNGVCVRCGSIHQYMSLYKDKVISILGDSISTFAGYIPTADGFNLEHLARYPQEDLLTDVNETWWMQVIQLLNAQLGENDSWRGTQVCNTSALENDGSNNGTKACMASLTRILNLGSNGTPDVIFFFGGTNDILQKKAIGTFVPDNAPTEVDLTAEQWDTVADAYVAAIMRMKYFYPDAQIVAILPTHSSYYDEATLNAYNAVFVSICIHYGVSYVDLDHCGISVSDLPDGIHPNEKGMDDITAAVMASLMEKCQLKAGENKVYSIKHDLHEADASCHYFKGISADRSFTEQISGNDLTVKVTMGGVDITAQAYKDGIVTIENVTGDIVIVAIGTSKTIYEDYLQPLPETICCGTNIWAALTSKNVYYTGTGWSNGGNSNVLSITFEVVAEDQIWANSFQASGINGGSRNGIRITWFDVQGVLKSMSPDEVYAEFEANGYLTAPDGTVAVNVTMWAESENNCVYILNRKHQYQSTITQPTCTEQGYTTHTCEHCGNSYVDDYVGIRIDKNINFVGMSIWYFDGRILPEWGTGGGEVASGFQTLLKEHFTFNSTTDYCYSGYTLGGKDENGSGSVLSKANTWTGSEGDIWTLDTIINDYVHGIPLGTIDDYYNDTGITTFYGALRMFRDKVEELSGENAIVLCASAIMPNYGNGKYTGTSPNDLGYTIGEYNLAMEIVAKLNSWYFVDQFNDSGITDENVKELTIDGVHLNNDGYKVAVQPWIKAISIFAHNYTAKNIAPTCTAQGYTTHTCEHCGDSYVDSYVSATGHQYKMGVCTVCSDTIKVFDQTVTVGNLTLTLNDDGLSYTVTKCDTSASGSLNIPSIYAGNGLPVTGLGSDALDDCTGLTSVNIPDSVTNIAEGAFAGCGNLTGIWVSENNTCYSSDSNGVLFDKDKSELIAAPGTIVSYVIPNSVASIGNFAFYGHTSLTSVTIPNSVTSIGNYAFYMCSNLTSIAIPDSVTSIGKYAFYKCSNLTSVTIGNKVRYIGAQAFAYCSSLTSITLPDSVTETGSGVFACCSKLQKAVLSKNITFLQASMFYYCTSLTDVTLPENLESMNGYVFQNCTSLVSITLPEGLTRIGGTTFKNCTALTNVVLPSTLTSILDNAFYNCTALVSITLPDSITSMGEFVFYNCTSLKTVNIPKGISVLNNFTFCYCNSLETITVPGNVKVLYNFSIGDCDNLKEIIFCEGVTTLESLAIAGNKSLTSVVLPDSLSAIRQQCFSGCTSLKSVSLPAGIASIEFSAFDSTALTDVYFRGSAEEWAAVNVESKGNTKLLNATMHFSVFKGTCGDDLTWELRDGTLTIIGTGTIPDYATGTAPWYSNRADITKIVLPKSVTVIGNNAFEGCNAVTQIEYAGTKDDWANVSKGTGNDILTSGSIVYGKENLIASGTLSDGSIQWKLDTEGILTIYGSGDIPDHESGTAPWYAYRSQINTIIVGKGITGIGAYNFAGIGAVSAVSLPDGLTKLGDYAFSDCIGFTGINLPNSVVSLGTGVFYKCDGLKTITLPSKITVIPNNCFYQCSALTGVKLEGKVTEIGEYAFYFCDKLKDFQLPASLKTIKGWAFLFCYSLEQIDLPNGLETIERSAFGQCDSLVSVVIPDSVKTLGESAFYSCDSLVYIKLPNGLTEIPEDFAQQSSKLQTVIIPGSVTSIGRMAFRQTALTNVIYCGTEDQWSKIAIDEYNDELLSASRTSHQYNTVVTAPTCTAQGYTTHTCHCGDSYVDSYVDALGHEYGDWFETKAPTCTAKGEKRHNCKNCDHFVTEEVAALGHDLIHHDGQNATCTEDGWKAYDTCSRCEHTTYEKITATGHQYVASVTDPTCTKQGYTTHTCHCGDSYVDSYVAAKGHDYGDWFETKAPTCTEKGEKRHNCKNCDHFVTEEVAAKGHDLIHHDGQNATCTEDGWKAYDTCSRCDHTTYEKITATGHQYVASVTDPTCTEKGYTTHTCHCGDSYVDSYVAAKGHDLIHHDGQNATCTEDGWKAYDTCSRCDHTTYEKIGSTGHHYTDVKTPPPVQKRVTPPTPATVAIATWTH